MKLQLLIPVALLLLVACREDNETTRSIQFAPAAATEGGTVIITGKDFDLEASKNIVMINGVEAEVFHAIPTHLFIKVPAKASTGPITISTSKGKIRSSSDLKIVEGSGTWQKKADFPGGYRVGAIGFSHAGFGYAGFGQNSDTENITDFWKYNPALNTWTALAVPELVLPPDNNGFQVSGSFVSGDDAFVVFTAFPGGSRVVMKYHFASNEWSVVENPHEDNWNQWPTGRYAAVVNGVVTFGNLNGDVGNKTLPVYNVETKEWSMSAAFPGNSTAFNPSIMGSKIYYWELLGPPVPLRWEYNITTDSWTSDQMPDFSGPVNNSPLTFTLGGSLYYVAGTLNLFPWGYEAIGDGKKYIPSTKSWEFIKTSPLTGGSVCFTLDGKAYIVFGYKILENEHTAEMYEFTP